jgi:YHS domain-containing protein
MADESRIVKDPICGKDVDTLRARAVAIFGGVTFYFCSPECKAKYRDPRQQGGSGEWSGPERRAVERPPQPKLAVPPTPAAPERTEQGELRVVAPAAVVTSRPVVEEPRRDRAVAAADEPGLDVPARRSVPWLALVLTLLMVAGAVLLFTLRK